MSAAHGVADVCLVGVGHAGGIIAKELCSAGLKVVGLEGGRIPTLADYGPRDTMRFIVRDRNWTSVLGGATLHWTGQSARYQPGDFKIYSNEVLSGVAERAGADLTGYEVVDWPLSYDDLEPYYTRYEWELGISGLTGDNPFAGPRSRPFPLPPLRTTAKEELFGPAARRLGYHPYKSAAGILSQAYRPPAPFDTRIPERPACVYCGHCNGYGCHVNAKAAALYTVIPVALDTGNFDLRTNCRVIRVNTDGNGCATGVSYLDAEAQVQEQRARVVIMATGGVAEPARLLLLSRVANSSGMVGKGIGGLGPVAVLGIYDDYVVNSFIGPGSGGLKMDDFNGNNFDHTGLGFIRGGTMSANSLGTPLEAMDAIPPGMPNWGKEYKEFFSRYYTRTLRIGITLETLPHRDNLVELDPSEQDAMGLPIPKMTFTFHENERRMARFLAEVGERIMRETGANRVWTKGLGRNATRASGGTRMGDDPATSVVNHLCQSHDVPNLFIVGASVFPTVTAYPGTATISALAYRTAEHIAGQREWFR
jgi:gluconate 2-dehydrogenase alpha chain